MKPAAVTLSEHSHPGRFKAWLIAFRLPTLSAAIVPVLVGSAAASESGYFRFLPFLAALVAALLIQIGTNLANDYFDFHKGADNAERMGPLRVTQSGIIAPHTVRIAAILAFGLSALVGVYLIAVGGWLILMIGVLSILAGVLYTGGPWPLGYNGLGDLLAFTFFGLIAVVGTFYLHAGQLVPSAMVVAVPVGLLVTAILVVNNLRDIDSDRAAGKRTLAVLIGREATQIQFLLLVAVAYLLVGARWFLGADSTWFWLPWLTLPLAVSISRAVISQEGRFLNRVLRRTAMLHLIFGVLFAASLVI